MTDQPEALRVADLMAQRVWPRWIHATGGTPLQTGFKPDSECQYAARLLREQHAEIERLREANEALRRDAERWRWHRADVANHMGTSPEVIDAAIDATMGDKP